MTYHNTDQTRIWFELENPFKLRDKPVMETGKTPQEKLMIIVRKLEDDYNRFFHRLGYKYQKVWWHDDGYWCFTTGVDGQYLTTDMKTPGFWANVNYLPIEKRGQEDVA